MDLCVFGLEYAAIMCILYVRNLPRRTAKSFHVSPQLRCWFCELSLFSFSFSLSASILSKLYLNCLIGTFVERKVMEMEIPTQMPEITLPP